MSNNTASWPILKKPPVIMAVFQINFGKGEIPLTEYLKFESELRRILPKRSDNIQADINVPSTFTLGVSKIISTSNAKLTSYTYFSEDQKTKLSLAGNSITFNDEKEYSGWENFKSSIKKYLDILSPLLAKYTITRVSIRFINSFVFDTFDDPTQYFKTTISSTEENGFPFSVLKYGFRLMLNFPNKNARAIVNQNVDNPAQSKFIYLFDIDVIEQKNLIFDVQSILDSLEKLRNIKNDIFFDNLTDKTIELCN